MLDLEQWTSKLCPFHIHIKNSFFVQIHFNGYILLASPIYKKLCY